METFLELILLDKTIGTKSKMEVMDMYILPVLTHGSQTWTPTRWNSQSQRKI